MTELTYTSTMTEPLIHLLADAFRVPQQRLLDTGVISATEARAREADAQAFYDRCSRWIEQALKRRDRLYERALVRLLREPRRSKGWRRHVRRQKARRR